MIKKIVSRKIVFLAILVIVIFSISSFVYFDIPVEELKKDYANEFSQFIELDGMQVHYRDEGQGFPIVLIHGTASSLHTWDDWTQELKKEYRVIRMDLPAFGLTGPNTSGDYSIEFYTKFLNHFINELKLNTFHLAGNSLGGNIAWNYTAENPNRVKKLVLVDASGLPTNKPQPAVFKMAKTPLINSSFLYITPKFFIKKNMREVYEDDTKITDELVTRYHQLALREGNRQAFIDRAKIDFKPNEKENLEKLQSIQNATLLLWGAKDTWIPLDNGKRMDGLLPNSQLKVIQNSGHVPMEENPKESLKIFREFIYL
ncbi:alpha/beta hydrolase [Urechidicola sp. KH5]